MIFHLVEKICRDKGWTSPKVLRDVDGSGMGNGAITLREERPESGGIITYLYGYKYPYKGSPDGTVVGNLATIKRNVRLLLESLKGWQTKAMIGLIFLLPKRLMWFLAKDFVDYVGLMIDYYLSFHLLSPKRYAPCVREIYRALDLMVGRKRPEGEKRAIEMMRDFLCMSVEYDSAYRFRFYDIILKANKKRLLENPRKEMERLFGILISREVYDGMKDRWGQTKKPILLALRVPLIRNLFREFVKELNFGKLKPDEADRYFCLLRQDYEFFGKTLPERVEERKKIEGDNWIYFDELANCFLREYEVAKKTGRWRQ